MSSVAKGQVGTGIVGLGKVARTHAEALAQLPQSRFVAACDYNPERAATNREFNVRPYTNLEEMLADPDIQAITICTPHPLHAEQAVMAAEAGKHVLVEKPLALTVVPTATR